MTDYRAFRFLTRCLALTERDHRGRARLEREICSDRVPWEKVIEQASRDYVIGALGAALREHGLDTILPEDVAEYLEEMRALSADRNRRVREQVIEMARVLNTLGVEPVLLKGAAHLISGLYRDPASRLMEDIDVLVPAERIRACFDRLLADGYEIEREVKSECHHIHPLQRPGRPALVELHRRIAQDHGEPLVTGPQVVSRSRRLSIDGVTLRVPCPTDSAIIAVSHSYVYHQFHAKGGVALRDLYDLMLLDRQPADRPNWLEVSHCFAASGYGPLLGRCVSMAARVFGQPSPSTTGVRRASPWDWWRVCLQLSHPQVRYWMLFSHERIENVRYLLRDADSSSETAAHSRRRLFSPATYGKNLRAMLGLGRKSP